MKSVSILGVEVGKIYSYDARPKVDWTDEEDRAWKRAEF